MSCFFFFLCEISRHYSKIWQIDLNLFLFFCSFLLHIRSLFRIRWLGVRGCFSLGNSRILVIASEAKQSHQIAVIAREAKQSHSNHRHCEALKKPKQSHSKFSHYGNSDIAEIPSLRGFEKAEAIPFKIPSLRGFEKAEAIPFKSPSLRGSKATEAISFKIQSLREFRHCRNSVIARSE
ncbi:MAG: hypothetical protein SOY61_03025 [Campylobacter sp.]|nr:hypothetical protein [Campylobacter sp.]